MIAISSSPPISAFSETFLLNAAVSIKWSTTGIFTSGPSRLFSEDQVLYQRIRGRVVTREGKKFGDGETTNRQLVIREKKTYLPNSFSNDKYLFFIISILIFKIYLFLERSKRREKERKRNINVWLPLARPLLGTWPATQACVLTGNWTSNPLVCRLVLNPLSHTSPGCQELF